MSNVIYACILSRVFHERASIPKTCKVILTFPERQELIQSRGNNKI